MGPGGQFDDRLQTIPVEFFAARIELVELFRDRLKPFDEGINLADDKCGFRSFAPADIDRLPLKSRLTPEPADELWVRNVQSGHRLPVPSLDGRNAEPAALPGPPGDVIKHLLQVGLELGAVRVPVSHEAFCEPPRPQVRLRVAPWRPPWGPARRELLRPR